MYNECDLFFSCGGFFAFLETRTGRGFPFEMARTFKPTVAEKISALHDVEYEIGRCFLQEPFEVLENEAWLLKLVHGRGLIDFFEHTEEDAFKDDVLAWDFGFTPSRLDLSQTFRDRLNKDLAHITYSRQSHTPKTKPWNLNDIDPILDRSIQFSGYISKGCTLPIPEELRAYWRKFQQAIISKDHRFSPFGTSAIGL